MDPDGTIPHHLSAEEHLLHAAEDELLKDGRQWLRRAAKLYTQTPKIKIWVPVVCSIVMTSYYLYAMHSRTTSPPELTPAAAGSAPVAVAEEPSRPAGPAAVAIPVSADTNTPVSDDNALDSLKLAQQARTGQHFSEEAALLQKVFDQSRAPQQVCPAIGKAYERAGEMDSSVQAFEKCLALAPEDLDTMTALAHALQAKSDFGRAATLYRQCLLKDPVNLDAQTGLALIELKQNHLHEADAGVLTILHKSPDNTDALLIAGIVAWRQERLADAERLFSRGAKLDDRRADFHAFLGRVAEAQRRPQDALQQYEKALLLAPDDGDIADRRDRLRDIR